MDIVALKKETFDNFLLKAKEINKIQIQQALENYDKEIYCSIDHNRFVLIRLDERTILSSYGIIKFKRRYYYDYFLGQYCYLLDNKLNLPKSKRMTNELILKILDLASIMSYKEVGEHLSDEFTLSKSTICRTIKEVLLEVNFDNDIDRGNNKIHIQIDEKFIGMINSTNKRKYYTLTIFAGKENNGNTSKLLNKTVISSAFLDKLKIKVNDLLINRYHVSINEEVFISGDFATYIKHFGESITCCKSRYVPNKFHVYKALKDTIPDVYVDDESLVNRDFQKYLIKELSNIEDINAYKLKSLLVKNPSCFETYLDKEYLGCSQECQNSHIYAPRFGKYANRFCPSTIEKLSLIREAKVMKAKVTLVYKNRILPDDIMFKLPELDLEDPIQYALDTRNMKHDTRKLFNAIKYGYV